jgi:Uma2 family endonuclease
VEGENITRMTTVLREPDQTVILRGIHWDTYERLLADQQESSGTRLNFDCGTLEIVSPSSEHEQLKETITLLFQLMASELEIDVVAAGSTTFRRKDLRKGFEPDASFYIRNAQAVRKRPQIDLRRDPPPDVVVEIEITSPAIDKLSIFAAAAVPEVWLYRDDRVEILALESKTYQKKMESSFLPVVTDEVLTSFVRSSRTMTSVEWIKAVRTWAKR